MGGGRGGRREPSLGLWPEAELEDPKQTPVLLEPLLSGQHK